MGRAREYRSRRESLEGTFPSIMMLHTRKLLKTTWCTDKLLLGASQVELDFEVLCSVAAMLYGSSFVAERYSGIRSFLEQGKKVWLSVYT